MKPIPILFLLAGCGLCLAQSGAKGKPKIPAEYFLKLWPEMEDCLREWENGAERPTEICLGDLEHRRVALPGVYHLRAQMARRRDALDEAEELIDKALALEPDRHVHHYQKGLIAVSRIKKADSGMGKWKWAQKALDAHQKAFELEPTIYTYREYIVMHKLSAPAIGGGNKKEALKLAEEGLELGVSQCLLLKGYAHLQLEEEAEAYAAFDEALRQDLFNYRFVKAVGDHAAEAEQWDRAEPYYLHLVKHIPEHPISHYILGDFYDKKGDRQKARSCFETVKSLDPLYMDVAKRLDILNKAE